MESKGRKTIAAAEFQNDAILKRVGRLREVPTIELQQQLLVDMGRIGQIANPPGTFSVLIALYAISPEATLRAVETPRLSGAVCYVGRDQDSKRVDHLVLSEAACDALFRAVSDLQLDQVHNLSRPSLTALKTDLGFFEKFEKGLIEVPLKTAKLIPLTGTNNLIYLHLVRNEGPAEGETVQGNYRNAPLIMKISDVTDA